MKNAIKKLKLATMTILFTFAFGSINTALAEKARVDLLSSPFGTSSYIIGTALEEITRDSDAPLQVGHSESPGVAYNLIKMAKKPALKKTTIQANSIQLIYMARAGAGPFKRMKGGIAKDIRQIANYNVTARFYVSRDPAIKEITDLKGKSIGLGTKQQAWGFAAIWDLTLAGGMKPNQFKPQLIGTKAAISAFKDRLVDAVVGGAYINPVTGQYVPAPFFRELTATGEKLYYINVGEKGLRRESKMLRIPHSAFTLKPENVPGLNQPITISISTLGWWAYLDFPEEQAYQLTKVLIKNVDKFAKYHALGQLMSKEMLCYQFTPEETHPGAYRAYKEAGLMK